MSRQKTPGRSRTLPEWAETAYRMWCRGERNLSELARMLGVNRQTVKSNIIKFARAVREAAEGEGIVDAYQETVTAYEEVLAAAWRDHAAAGENWAVRAGFLRVIRETIERLAALRGIVGQRVALEHSLVDNLADMPLEELVRIAGGHSDGSDNGGVSN